MNEWLPIVSLIVAIGVAVFVFVTRGEPVTSYNLQTAVDSVRPIASELASVATTVVQGIEQVKREPGSQLTNEQAYHDALNAVRGWLSAIDPDYKLSITNEQIIMAINSAILVASSLTHAIAESKAVVADANPGATVDPSNIRLRSG